MVRYRTLIVVIAAIVSAQASPGADVALSTASGRIVKANANVVIIQTRAAGGQFGEKLAVKVRGTSKLTMLSAQTRDGQVVVAQRDVEAKDLQPTQAIAVIYANTGEEFVLLSAVVQPLQKK